MAVFEFVLRCFNFCQGGIVNPNAILFAVKASLALRLTGQHHACSARRVGALAQPVFKRQGLFFKGVLCAQAHRVDDHGEHAIEHRALVVGFAVPCAAAGEGTAQKLASHGHAKTFVFAKGHECAKETI